MTTKSASSKKSSTKSPSSKTSSSKASSSKSSSIKPPSSKSSLTKASSIKTSSSKASSSQSSLRVSSTSKLSSSKYLSSTRASSSQTLPSKLSLSTISSLRSISTSASSFRQSSRSSTSTSSVSSSSKSTSGTTSKSSTTTLDAYDLITSHYLEAFCTAYLGYTASSVTQTLTLSNNATKTVLFTSEITSTIISLTTETEFVQTVTLTSTISTPDASTITLIPRALETPSALISYPETKIRSACSKAATRLVTVTISETVIFTSTGTVATTATLTSYETYTSIVVESATSTVVTSVPAPKPTQVLVNGDFSNGAQGWSGSSFNVSDGQGVITLSGGDATLVLQDVPRIEGGQPYSLSADVWAEIQSGTTCSMWFSAGRMRAWQQLDVTGFQSWVIRDLQGVADRSSSDFFFYLTCQGTSVATIRFDNVALDYYR
jgi:hypothetical protein